MRWGNTKILQRSKVFLCRIACVAVPAIAGMLLRQIHHDPVPGDLGNDGSGGDGQAARIAANDGFDEGLRQGGPCLLEPLMKMEITTPEDYMGEIVGDLQQRRALIERTENRGAMTTIFAQAPLKELFGYSSAIRSLSQGRAGCSMEPCGYQEAPAADADAFGL